MTIRFLRNKVVEVEPQADGTIWTSWRLTDDLLRADVNLQVQPPDLEIVQAEAELGRLVPEAWQSAAESDPADLSPARRVLPACAHP